MRILTFILILASSSIYAQNDYKIMMEGNKELNVQKVIIKDSTTYVVDINYRTYIIDRNKIKFVSPQITMMPISKLNTAGSLLHSGAGSLLFGMGVGALGTGASLLLPQFISGSEKVAGYIGIGANLLSIGFAIDGLSKIRKAGKVLDAKKY